MNYLSIAFLGCGATLLTDLWSLARRRLLDVPAPDFALVGRWIGHMPRGRFRHPRIAAAAPVAGEHAIGWIAHYLIGIGFAAILIVFTGPRWLDQPEPGSAMLLGLATVFAPFLIMQPGMGAGFFASRAPRPNAARLQSLITHLFFGLGLYASGLLIASH